MKNGDEKWNSVLYDYQHMRYINSNNSAWWLLEDQLFKYAGEIPAYFFKKYLFLNWNFHFS